MSHKDNPPLRLTESERATRVISYAIGMTILSVLMILIYFLFLRLQLELLPGVGRPLTSQAKFALDLVGFLVNGIPFYMVFFFFIYMFAYSWAYGRRKPINPRKFTLTLMKAHVILFGIHYVPIFYSVMKRMF